LNKKLSTDQEIPCTMEFGEVCPSVMRTKKCVQSRLCAKIVTWYAEEKWWLFCRITMPLLQACHVNSSLETTQQVSGVS